MNAHLLKQEDTIKGLSRQEPALALAWHKPDLFITMIKLLPESDRIIVNHSPRSIFNLIAEMKQPLLAKMVLELLPITDRIAYIKENGERLLSWGVRTPELVSTIIKSLPESERLPTIKKFSDGDSFLWSASDTPESFRIILSFTLKMSEPLSSLVVRYLATHLLRLIKNQNLMCLK